MPFAARALLALAFIIFSVCASFMWTIGRDHFAWWLPFAAAVGFPGIVAVAITIVEPGIWHD